MSASADDAEQRPDGSVARSSSDLELVVDSGNVQVVGMRFTGIEIPPGAVIQDAWIQFQVDESSSGASSLVFEGEDVDDAGSFTNTDFGISSRPRTSADVAWAPAAWPTVGAAGAAQRTPDLASIVQEILDRPGWSSGNDVVFIVTGSGERVAESFNGDPSGAALLHVEFSTSFNLPPTVDAGPDASLNLPANTVVLDGTVVDDPFTGFLANQWTHVGGTGAGTVTFADASAEDTTATISAEPGTYVLRLTADDSEFVRFDELTVTLFAPGTATFDLRIGSTQNDAEENINGSVVLTSSDLELVFDRGGNQTVGLRFTGVPIPNGATIQEAYVQFQVDETPSAATSVTIEGQASDQAPPFVSVAGNLSTRARTSASVGWSPPAWPNVGEAGLAQRTPDLSPILQQIVDRGGWSAGNALALLITGSGERVAESYDGVASAAPLLHVEYFAGPPVNQPPTVDAGAPTMITLPTNVVALNGTVADDGLTGTLITNWSHVGGTGSGSVSFANPGAVDTTATFSADDGTYVLRLTADDSEYLVSDEVTVTVLPEGVIQTLIDADFNSSLEGFAYADDTFRGTNQPAYASGTRLSNGGFSGGGLQVLVGGVNGSDITNMSGGFARTFSLPEPAAVSVSLQCNLTMDGAYESDELSQALLSIDGVLYGAGPNDSLLQLVGDGNSGPDISTGWQTIELQLGILSAGNHSFVVGGFNNKKTTTDEVTEVRVDNVLVIGDTGGIVNTPPSVDAGSDQNVPLSAGALLDGTVTDDGLPFPPGALTTLWSRVSGPQGVTFANPQAVDTTASFPTTGTYVLRLTADDSVLDASDEVTIVVSSGDPNITSLSQVGHFATGFVNGNPLTIPSIDPAGVAYHPPTGRLFLADSEITEIPSVWNLIQANIFEVARTGDTLFDSFDVTISPSGLPTNRETTGIAYCDSDAHFYVTNDDSRRLFRYSFNGNDLTAVDSTSTVSQTIDPEGVACNPANGRLYVVGGDLGIGVYRYQGGFILVDSFNLANTAGSQSGIPDDPEGIVYDSASSHLFVLSDPDERLYEFTTSGSFVRSFDLSSLSPSPIGMQGISIGPSSGVQGGESFYIVDGGIDNDANPNERDGAVYEMLITRGQ
ncbi:MAG: hypothetical protein GY711_05520 [bacterium]|nr:hypothetical protein [bacterium]